MKLKKIIKNIDNLYPNDFHDFSNGKKVNNKDIRKYIIECLESIKKDINKGKKNTYHYIQIGNLFVIVFIYKNKKDNSYNLEINITENYKELTISKVKL